MHYRCANAAGQSELRQKICNAKQALCYSSFPILKHRFLKEHAKLQLFFELCKFFGEKIQTFSPKTSFFRIFSRFQAL